MCAVNAKVIDATDKCIIRVFVKDKNSGAPVSDLPVMLKGDADKNFGLLVTDVYGYVSFKPDALEVSRYKVLSVEPMGQPNFGLQIEVAQLAAGREVFLMEVPRERLESIGDFPGLPSYQSPDKLDYQVAKDLLASRPVITNGNFDCSRPVPNPDSTVEFEVQQLAFLEDQQPRSFEPGGFGTTPGCIPDELREESLSFMRGKMIDYLVGWTFMGHSMGELLNSFSLAPCESVNLATIDWNRTDDLIREEATAAFESVVYESRRDQMIAETMNGVIRDRTFGGSFGTGASVSFPIGKVAKGNAFLGGTIGGGTSSRDLSLRTLQNMRDTLRTEASSVRQQHRVAVVQATQTESQTIQTRNITNHNKCHTLNLMYYEVLRHYEVSAQAQREREVLLIEYCIEELTPEDVIGKSHILKEALLDPSLAGCFDALKRVTYCITKEDEDGGQVVGSDGGVSQETVTEKRDVSVNKMRVTVKIGNNGTDGQLFFFVPGTSIRQLIPGETSGQAYRKNRTYQLTFNVPPTLLARDINEIGIENKKDSSFDGAVKIQSLNVTYNSPEVTGTFQLYNKSFDVRINGNTQWTDNATASLTEYDVQVPVEATEFNDVVEGVAKKDTAKEDQCCADILMAHISENLAYYNAVLWFNEDQVERSIRFGQFNYNGQPLPTQILNQPLGVIGNYVAFEINNVDPTPIEPAVRPVVETLILPTRGVFAESLLGECSSCETYVDETGNEMEYRDFECNCSAPDIGVTAATPANNAALFGIQPGALGDSNINIQAGGSGETGSLLSGLASIINSGSAINNVTQLSAFLTALGTSLQNTPTGLQTPAPGSGNTTPSTPSTPSGGGGGNGEDLIA